MAASLNLSVFESLYIGSRESQPASRGTSTSYFTAVEGEGSERFVTHDLAGLPLSVRSSHAASVIIARDRRRGVFNFLMLSHRLSSPLIVPNNG